MAGASHGDVSSTLGELERKLRELERELQSAGSAASSPPRSEPSHPEPSHPGPPQPESWRAEPPQLESWRAEPPQPEPPRVEPPPAQLVEEARASLGGLHDQLGELHRFRERLERSVRELTEEYSRVLAVLERDAGTAPPPPAPAFAPAPPPAPPAFAPAPAPPAFAPAPPPAPPAPTPPAFAPAPPAFDPGPAAPPPAPPAFAPAPPPAFAPAPPAPAFAAPPPPPFDEPAVPADGGPQGWGPTHHHGQLEWQPAHPHGPEEVVVSGHVTVDAGPFRDIASLSSFEQALGRVPGAQDVYVRGFEGNRALIDVQLGHPVDLAAELRHAAPTGLDIAARAPGHVEVTVHGS